MNYFNKAYKKNGYLDKYGGSVIATAFTLLFFFIIFSYYYVQSKIEPIRQNWANERCKPEVMPFAGMINAPKGTSASDVYYRKFYAMYYTNFINYCKLFYATVLLYYNHYSPSLW